MDLNGPIKSIDTNSSLTSAAMPSVGPAQILPVSFTFTPAKDRRTVIVRWSHSGAPSTSPSGVTVEFQVATQSISFGKVDWESEIKTKLMQMGAGVLEAELAAGASPFSTKFFKNVAALYEFTLLACCKLNLDSAPVLRMTQGARITDVEVEDAILRIQGKDLKVNNLKCTRSHLALYCEDSSILKLAVDCQSSLSGSLRGSILWESCRIHGYARDVDFTDVFWKYKDQQDLEGRLKGMDFDANKVTGEVFKNILGGIVPGAAATACLQAQTWSTKRLIDLVSRLTPVWDCTLFQGDLGATSLLASQGEVLTHKIILPKLRTFQMVLALELPISKLQLPDVLVSYKDSLDIGDVGSEKMLDSRVETYDCLLGHLAAYSEQLGTLFKNPRLEADMWVSFAAGIVDRPYPDRPVKLRGNDLQLLQVNPQHYFISYCSGVNADGAPSEVWFEVPKSVIIGPKYPSFVLHLCELFDGTVLADGNLLGSNFFKALAKRFPIYKLKNCERRNDEIWLMIMEGAEIDGLSLVKCRVELIGFDVVAKNVNLRNSHLKVSLESIRFEGLKMEIGSRLSGVVQTSSFDGACAVHYSVVSYKGFQDAEIEGDEVGRRWRYTSFKEDEQPMAFVFTVQSPTSETGYRYVKQ
ncbi:MAG: hypothetical protein GX589_01400 [Deltaproteobacteria bacterium]|nr:hypothetical protein [Deltaproteobacteria bacterium]